MRDRDERDVRQGTPEARRVVGSANGDDGSRCGVRDRRVRQRADAGILWTPRTGETGVSSRIYQRGVEDIAVRRVLVFAVVVAQGRGSEVCAVDAD